MFDSLDEQMKHDAAVQTSQSERFFKWAVIAIVSVLAFGSLYLSIQMME